MLSYIRLKVRSVDAFKTQKDRDRFVRFVSELLSAGTSKFEPYALNSGGGGLEWQVDSGNDWFVFFDSEDAQLVRIQHRYADEGALRPLAEWVAYRWRAEIVRTSNTSSTPA